MQTESIITALDAEIAKLQEARMLLATDSKLDGAIVRKSAKKVSVKPPKRILSPEAKQRIADAQRKRWAAVKKLKSAGPLKKTKKAAKKASPVKAKKAASKKAAKTVPGGAKPEAQKVEAPF